MDEKSKGVELFSELRQLLQVIAGMDSTEAAIYVLGLERGVITTREAMAFTNGQQTTAGSVLRRLTGRGFFEKTLGEEKAKGGKGHGQKFRAVRPGSALKGVLGGYGRLQELLGAIDEHMDYMAQQDILEDEVWQIPTNVSIEHLCGSIASAEKSIRISSNDCSWALDEDIFRAIKEAAGRKLVIEVVVSKVSEVESTRLMSLGLTPRIAPDPSQPFALIDGKALYQSIRFGQTSTHYGALFTKNPYMVRNHISSFETRYRGPEVIKDD